MDQPKNFASFDSEVRPQPVPATRSHPIKTLDGSFAARRHRESNLDIHMLAEKLTCLSREQQRKYADQALHKHYIENFKRKDTTKWFKVFIEYMDLKEKYIIRTPRNTLTDVKAKLPIKGNFRLFFVHANNEIEEVEEEGANLPYREKDGALVIHCRAFAK